MNALKLLNGVGAPLLCVLYVLCMITMMGACIAYFERRHEHGQEQIMKCVEEGYTPDFCAKVFG